MCLCESKQHSGEESGVRVGEIYFSIKSPSTAANTLLPGDKTTHYSRVSHCVPMHVRVHLSVYTLTHTHTHTHNEWELV